MVIVVQRILQKLAYDEKILQCIVLTGATTSQSAVDLSLNHRNHFGLININGNAGPIMNIMPRNELKYSIKRNSIPPKGFLSIVNNVNTNPAAISYNVDNIGVCISQYIVTVPG